MTSEERMKAAAQVVKDLAATREKLLAGEIEAAAASAMAKLCSATALMLGAAKAADDKDWLIDG